MPTKLIQLGDGLLIEVDASEDEVRQISGGVVDKVSTTIDKIESILVKVCRPVTAAWQAIEQDMDVEQAEVELGLSFEGEGNLYVTKAKANANLTVKLVLKPRIATE